MVCWRCSRQVKKADGVIRTAHGVLCLFLSWELLRGTPAHCDQMKKSRVLERSSPIAICKCLRLHKAVNRKEAPCTASQPFFLFLCKRNVPQIQDDPSPGCQISKLWDEMSVWRAPETERVWAMGKSRHSLWFVHQTARMPLFDHDEQYEVMGFTCKGFLCHGILLDGLAEQDGRRGGFVMEVDS